MASMNSDDEAEESENETFISTSKEANIDLEDLDLQPAMTEDETRRRRLAALTRDPNVQIPSKGLYAIKFMKRAMDRSLDEAERKLNQVDDYEEGEEESKAAEEDENAPVGRKVIGAKGGAKPTITASKSNVTINNGEIIEVSVGHKARVAGPISAGKFENVSKVVVSKEEDNKATSILNQTQYSDKPVTQNLRKNQAKREAKERKAQMKLEASANKEVKDSAPAEDVESNPWMQETEMPSNDTEEANNDVYSNKKGEDKLEFTAHDASDNDTDMIDSKEDNDDDDEQTKLLRRAFAADNVVEEFVQENEKKPKTRSVSEMVTPGWGTWFGEGFSQPKPTPKKTKSPKKTKNNSQPTTPSKTDTSKTTKTPTPNTKTKTNVTTKPDPTTNSTKKKNTPTSKKAMPANNKRVVGKAVQMKTITKKKEAPVYMHEDKTKLSVPSKYQVRNLPFGIDSAEEFKKSMNTPLGKEWIPSLAHAAVTKPRIVTKPGLAITPISLSTEQESKYKEKAANYVKKYHTTTAK